MSLSSCIGGERKASARRRESSPWVGLEGQSVKITADRRSEAGNITSLEAFNCSNNYRLQNLNSDAQNPQSRGKWKKLPKCTQKDILRGRQHLSLK
mmetsp:Transcript_5921/g.17804  ORF Transcript_5921/g.17804 Transcript_5921/m.17804 type:complete len:96 (+) Transcript_5921:1495-1782(+)